MSVELRDVLEGIARELEMPNGISRESMVRVIRSWLADPELMVRDHEFVKALRGLQSIDCTAVEGRT